jgi:AAA domain
VDPDTTVRQVIGRTRDREQDRGVSNLATKRAFNRLASPDGLTAQASTFARQDVIAALGGEFAGATRAELEGLADRFLAEQAVSVVAERAVEERRWSTPELLGVEQRLVAAATDRAGEQTAVVGHDAVRAALRAYPTADADQQAMVRDVCQGGAGVAVDEAGMAGSCKLGRLLDHARQGGAKVVLVGDDRQLAAIDAGGGFRALRLRLGALELVENRRQQQVWEREALELVRSGLVEEAVAAYRAHDRVVCAESKPAAHPGAAQ